MMTLLLLLLAALIGLLAFWYRRYRADSTFENAFHEHIAPIADYCFYTKIPSHSAAILDCTPMDILWLEYEANGGISLKRAWEVHILATSISSAQMKYTMVPVRSIVGCQSSSGRRDLARRSY
jgi:hypothetical protein